MGAFRCVACSINFPQEAIINAQCPICEGEVKWRATSKPHRDWKDQVAIRIQTVDVGTAPDTWIRAERLMKCGVDIGTALAWASLRTQFGGYEIDVHDFEKEYNKLRAAGCEHETAIKILAPVENQTSKAL